MQSRILIILSLALCALIVCGCRATQKPPEQPSTVAPATEPAPDAAKEEPVPPELQKALDNMGLEKAPTLGPVFRQIILDFAAKKYDKIYDSAHESYKESIALQMETDFLYWLLAVQEISEQLDKADLPDSERTSLTDQLQYAQQSLEEMESLNGDPEKYFVWYMERITKTHNPVDDIISGRMTVEFEHVDADTGSIMIMLSEDLHMLTFTKENGVWKLTLDDGLLNAPESALPAAEPEPAPQ
jgi:hypothetical protein